LGNKSIRVSLEGAGCLSKPQEIAQRAPWLHRASRQSIHLQETLIIEDKSTRCVKQKKALLHIVEGGVQVKLLLGDIVADAPGADEDGGSQCDHQNGEGRHAKNVRRPTDER